MVDELFASRESMLLHVGLVIAVLAGFAIVRLRPRLFTSNVDAILGLSWASLALVLVLRFLYWQDVLDGG